MEKEKKVTYADLNTPLKIAIILAWVVGVLGSIAFLIGFIEGIMGV